MTHENFDKLIETQRQKVLKEEALYEKLLKIECCPTFQALEPYQIDYILKIMANYPIEKTDELVEMVLTKL